MTIKTLARGWGWPYSARFAHYFIEGHSLCDHWDAVGVTLSTEPVTGPRQCPICTTKKESQ